VNINKYQVGLVGVVCCFCCALFFYIFGSEYLHNCLFSDIVTDCKHCHVLRG
jgi:hypothetical protein